MPDAPRPPAVSAVSAVHIGLVLCAAGVLLSFPISVGPAFTAMAEEQGIELSGLTRLFFSPVFGVLMALFPAALLLLASRIQGDRPRVARWLVRLAVVIGVGAAVLALMGLTELFFPPGATSS